MPRLAIFNILIGFICIFTSAVSGPFLVNDIETAFLKDSSLLHTWMLMLQKSAHGHLNLFGMLHILYGLTFNFSKLSKRLKFLQTLGLCAGSLAIGPGLFIKSYLPPQNNTLDIFSMILGVGLSLALISLALQIFGVAKKLYDAD